MARQRQLNWLERRLEGFARTKAGGWYFINVAMPVDRRLLPLTGGRLSSAPGQNVCLLESTGAKSGAKRQTPLAYVTDGDHIVLIGSKGGAPKHPAWVHNLRKNPRCRLLAPGRTGDYVAHEAEGDERARLWAKAVDYYDGYSTYQERTGGRVIPVLVLEPAR